MRIYYLALSVHISILLKLAFLKPDFWNVNAPRNINNTTSLHRNVVLQRVNVDVEIIRQSRECVYAHAIIRQLHNSKKVDWNEQLAYEAEQWAIYLASEVGQLQHSSFKFLNGTPYGENLYVYVGAVEPTRCHMAVHEWYKEIHNYNFDDPEVNMNTGHFTQLVWTTTRQVGIGIAYDKANKKTFVVARYLPPGNWNVDKSDIANFVHRMNPGKGIPTDSELLPSWARKPILSDLTVEEEIDMNDKTQPCLDNVDCTYFVKQGDCTNSAYKQYMFSNCYKSCTNCQPGFAINGGWSNWMKVSECTVSCGGGIVMWYRFCTKPTPRYDGKNCEGENMTTEPCNTNSCPQSKVVLVDKNTSCQPYADMGYCFAGVYMTWMQLNCKKSCAPYLNYFWMTNYY